MAGAGANIGCTSESKKSSWTVAASLDIPLELNRLRTKSNMLKCGHGILVSSNPILASIVATCDLCSSDRMSLVVAFTR